MRTLPTEPTDRKIVKSHPLLSFINIGQRGRSVPSKHCGTGPIPARYRHYCRNGTGRVLFSRYQGNGHLPLCTSAFYRPGAVNRNLTSNIQHRKVSLPASLSLLVQYRASNGPLYLTSINWYKPRPSTRSHKYITLLLSLTPYQYGVTTSTTKCQRHITGPVSGQ